MSREQVFADVRRALAARKGQAPRTPEAPYAIAAMDASERLARFLTRAVQHACSVERLDAIAQVPAAVQAYLEAHALPLQIASARPLAALDWPSVITRDTGAAVMQTRTAVSLAAAGIAESGTLAMCSGPDSPITHNFVPEYHIVVLREADIVAAQEDVWQRLRAGGAMPRAVNLIAGPSRTGDVEQTIQIGAHGPRAVHILLVGS
ncbi:LUD domain-containing protein [Niveibacterium sp. 24ML]|uniref:LutC/YkgG family protein n=1 Tax=Niveibacterium sp. 24ML TaxID=2985512 RepID=UPI002270F64E|nr:LUD domain-containing protein [Niveibacterium sp. 24ML]MCX9154770.1 LUD domain-containing protein [Niveibacterium sp. 24ML]